MRGRRNSKFRRRTGRAFQGSSSGASIVGCHASALARIFVDRSDAAADLHALAVVMGAHISVVLQALRTFFSGKSDIDWIQEQHRRDRSFFNASHCVSPLEA
jgi:hypothetical protein